MKKRILSFVLALVLVLSLAPLSALAAVSPFRDVRTGDYFFTPVLWAVENDVTAGLSATSFGPNVPCTRGQVVTFLWRAAGKPAPTSTDNPFTDVIKGQYYYDAVLWAVEQGITSGLSDTTFGPNVTCNRAQVVTFLHRANDTPAATKANPFTDVRSGDYFCNAVLWAVENGITSGLSDTTFGPSSDCTRGQIVTFLYRALSDSPAPTPTPTPTPDDEDKQKQFEEKDIYDFPEELVINFDNDPTTNFGVLNENVIKLQGVTAEKNGDGTYTFSSTDALTDLPLGTVVYVKSADGTPYLLSIGSIDGDTVTTDPDTPMSAYYTYLDAHFTTQIDTAAMARSSEKYYGASDTPGWNNKLQISQSGDSGITFGGTLTAENYELGITGSASSKSDGNAEYDVELFGEDYINFRLESTTSFEASVTGKLKDKMKLGSLNHEAEVGELPLVTIVPGLDLTLELKLPITLEAEVGFTGSLKVEQCERIEYKNTYENPLHTREEKTNTADIDCKGKVTLKAGIAAEIGVDFLNDKLELVLELKVMGGVRGTPESPDHSIANNPDTVHMCNACIKGEIFGEVSGEFKFQVNVSKKTKLELITVTLVKLEIPIRAFYVSLSSPADSIHKGELTFGFGTCPNVMARVTWKLQNEAGDPVTTAHTVRYALSDGTMNTTCSSNSAVYLYENYYGAAVEVDGEVGEAVTFRIKGFPVEVTLTVPEEDERSIYTKYLLNGGYESLKPENSPEKWKITEIRTNYGDFDGNGIKDLLLYFEVFWAGRQTRCVLYTIDEDSGEVVEVRRAYCYGGTGGGDWIYLRQNKNTKEPILMFHSTERLGIAKSVGTTEPFQLDGTSFTTVDQWKHHSYYLPQAENDYKSEVDALKQGTHVISSDGNMLDAWMVNGVQVTQAEYEAANYLEDLSTGSPFADYVGTYNVPIRPTT